MLRGGGFGFLLVLVSTAPGHAQAVSVFPAAPDTIAQVRSQYEDGFDLVRKAVHEADSTSQWPLYSLVRFYKQAVGWGWLDGRTYRALDSVPRYSAWLALVPPEHEAVHRTWRLLNVDAEANVPVVQIRPEAVTNPWAGLFLVHWISHLADVVLEAMPSEPTHRDFLAGELRAYELQLNAANLLTGGGFVEQLDAVLARSDPVSVDDVVRLARSLDVADFSSLCPATLSESPLSDGESRHRREFFTVSLLLRYGHVTGTELEELVRGLDALIVAPDQRH